MSIIEGNPISIQNDMIDNENWMVMKDSESKLILKIQKSLWDHSSELRDSVWKSVMGFFG